LERLVSFQNQGQSLYGMFHLPEGAGPWPGVALLHGFTGHRSESHFIFTKQARHLAQHGIAALRFDFRGSGESEGDFCEMTIEGEISDAAAALDFLQKQTEVDPARMGVLGLSLGGCVATCLAERDPRIRALILWSAPADLVHVITQGAANPSRSVAENPKGYDIGGLIVGPGFVQDVMRIRPLEAAQRFAGPVLVVHGTKDATVPPDHAQLCYEAFSGSKALRLVEGADHTYSLASWEEEVIAASTDWFVHHL